VESPRREASSPQILSDGAEIHMATLCYLWRAPSRPLADPHRLGHGLPLKFPTSSSPEVVRTHPSRVVRHSCPSSLLKGCVRVER
jgi:hypothetical protein